MIGPAPRIMMRLISVRRCRFANGDVQDWNSPAGALLTGGLVALPCAAATVLEPRDTAGAARDRRADRRARVRGRDPHSVGSDTGAAAAGLPLPAACVGDRCMTAALTMAARATGRTQTGHAHARSSRRGGWATRRGRSWAGLTRGRRQRGQRRVPPQARRALRIVGSCKMQVRPGHNCGVSRVCASVAVCDQTADWSCFCGCSDLREDADGEDHHPGGGVQRHHRQREGQDPGQRRCGLDALTPVNAQRRARTPGPHTPWLSPCEVPARGGRGGSLPPAAGPPSGTPRVVTDH